MTILWGGAHSGVYDEAMEEDAQDGSRDWLEMADGQSDITPVPRVGCQL